MGSKIESVLLRENELVSGAPPSVKNLKKVLDIIPDLNPKSMGVICLYDSSKTDKKLTELIKSKKVSIIIEHGGDFNFSPSRDGILNLITFLGVIRRRAVLSEGNKSLDVDMIKNT
ncbi:hypothetical protein [Maribacter sp. LLG6340-A2]|uniref:hypothetical protein n=1 Tax=Maribacter sp. LLG6340-A2 TaxID=3160834 RepID=UPI00386C25E0